uniref:Uncharacterized protein n=1 Tax=Octopus bimaculoides TaxID=37653 RepID=A0A0L8GTC1_OCTBM
MDDLLNTSVAKYSEIRVKYILKGTQVGAMEDELGMNLSQNVVRYDLRIVSLYHKEERFTLQLPLKQV